MVLHQGKAVSDGPIDESTRLASCGRSHEMQDLASPVIASNSTSACAHRKHLCKRQQLLSELLVVWHAGYCHNAQAL
jgi:hypothetical protein